jgi:hypothetical protein
MGMEAESEGLTELGFEMTKRPVSTDSVMNFSSLLQVN